MTDEPGSSGTPPRRSQSAWRWFQLGLAVTILAVLGLAFAALVVTNERVVEEELVSRGRAVFASMVLARKWNALHGGVFVEKTPGMLSNPYLDDPDRRGDDGTVYTKKNPALMTREISDIAEHEGAFRLRITSLKPVNPANAPGPFEREALLAFEKGAPEMSRREQIGGNPWFRYMAPLHVEAACLACHAKQGYQLGQVRGGISVSFGMADAEAAIRRSRVIGLVGFLLSAVVTAFLASWLVRGLRDRVTAAEAHSRQLALTDELTGLPNRRHAGERLHEEVARAVRHGRPLAVVMVDVDHFKSVNDTHGHEAGDLVLAALARAGQGVLRGSDLLGRWGGEEFLLVLPETSRAGARVLAERLRAAIADLEILARGAPVRVTISAGVSAWEPSAASPSAVDADALLREADDALYRAKQAGRNRVEG